MIFYSWTALSGSNQTAGRDGDRTAPAGSALTGLAENALTAPGAGGPGAAGSPVAMGITDDRGRAMAAGEEILGVGRAAVVIIEAVRPAMAARTLAPCYVRTGVAWLGRRTSAGEVTWNRFFFPAGPADQQALAGWAHETPDLH